MLSGLRETVQIQRSSVELDIAVVVSRPRVSRPITIEFNAVAVGVTQIKGFAHPMVGGPFESDSRIDDAVERYRKGRPRGV